MADVNRPISTGAQIEIEKTFLVRSIPSLEGVPFTRLVDIYLPAESPHPRLRARQKGQRFEVTKKIPVANEVSVHEEITIPLTGDEFAAISKGSDRRLEKFRFYYKTPAGQSEIDVFTGALTGLVLADFEFPVRSEMDRFSPPAFCGADVTAEDCIAGGVLSGMQPSEVFALLKRKYGYEKLDVKLPDEKSCFQ